MLLVRFSLKLSGFVFFPGQVKWVETMTQSLTTACWLGHFGHDVAFTDSSGHYQMTPPPFQKKTNSVTSAEHNVDQSQALLTLMFFC